VLDEEQVDERMLREWMKANQLALIVTRNQTSRDRADRQQPFNLRIPSGLKTTGDGGRIYDIAHYQIFEAAQVRGYNNFRSGRRPLAQPMAVSKNPANPSGPSSSVKIAADGSTAAFVPANRALTWQTTDASGAAIVRERVWVTMQPGEIRTCAGCHGENTRNQAGQSAPVNKPEALRELLRYWKQNLAPSERNGSRARVRPRTTQASMDVPPIASNTAVVSIRLREGAHLEDAHRDGTRR
jgi:mono/diheme cytochrome c family protein